MKFLAKGKSRSRSFTMVELLVALGIFSVMMLILMQFFNSAQSAWTNSEQRARLYSDSRVVFDLIANAVKGTSCDNISVTSAGDATGSGFFVPATLTCYSAPLPGGKVGTFSIKYENDEIKVLDPASTELNKYVAVVPNALEFDVRKYKKDFTRITSASMSEVAFIVVSLSLMTDFDLARYNEMKSDSGITADELKTFRYEHVCRFARMIVMPQVQ